MTRCKTMAGRLAGTTLIAAAVSACTAQAALQLSGLHEDDQWNWHDYRGAPMLDIHCPAGIGGVSLHATGGWPGVVVFRLHSNGLENFSVNINGVRYQLEAAPAGTTLYDPAIGNLLSLLPDRATSENSTYLVRMNLGAVHPTVDSLRVSWIDFYR